jgi:hypothetical protein
MTTGAWTRQVSSPFRRATRPPGHLAWSHAHPRSRHQRPRSSRSKNLNLDFGPIKKGAAPANLPLSPSGIRLIDPIARILIAPPNNDLHP